MSVTAASAELEPKRILPEVKPEVSVDYEQPLDQVQATTDQLPIQESRVPADIETIRPVPTVPRQRRIGKKAVVGGLAALAGVAATSANAQALDRVGPSLSSDKVQANKESDWFLSKTGPDGVYAQQLGRAFNIDTAKGRRKYITPNNIDLNRRRTVSNRKYQVNTASDGRSAVRIKNQHPTSEAWTVVAKAIARKSHRFVNKLNNNKFEAIGAAVRGICSNMLEVLNRIKPRPPKPPKPPRHPVTDNVSIDVSYGIKYDLLARARSESTSTSNVQVTCPDGTTTSVSAASYAAAFAQAGLAKKEMGEYKISGTNLTMVQAQLEYNRILKAEADAISSAATSTSVVVNCAPPKPNPTPTPTATTTPSATPTPTPPPKQRPPTAMAEVGDHNYVYGSGQACVDNKYDPDGDVVTSSNYRIIDRNGNQIARFTGAVRAIDADTDCQTFDITTGEPQEATFVADITDSKSPVQNVSARFPIVPEQFRNASVNERNLYIAKMIVKSNRNTFNLTETR